ncbi:unnamed protein product, partial [Symbiodinium sp. KB8]
MAGKSSGSGLHRSGTGDMKAASAAAGGETRGEVQSQLPDEFKDLKGQLLVEAVFSKWGSGTSTVPWLNEAGERNIRPDEVNRPIMESLCEAYVDRILESGLNVDCSGHGGSWWAGRAWMVYGPSQFPVTAITYGHRSEAMYRALQREPDNPYVKKALATGLESVRMLSNTVPVEVKAALCQMHNTYHEGAGETWLALLDRAEDLMNEWDLRNNGPHGTGLTTRNAQYDSFMEKFIFKEKNAQGWGDSLNFFKSTTILNNYLNKFFIKHDVRDWCNAHMSFGDHSLSNRDLIFMLHQMAVTTVSSMTKFYTKEFIGVAESNRVVTAVVTGHINAGAIMNYVTTPMATSAVFRRLEAEQDAAAKAAKAEGNSEQPAADSAKGSAKKKAKSKAKAKGKGKSDASTDANAANAGTVPGPGEWSPLAIPAEGSEGHADMSRPKTVMDDFMTIMLESFARAEKKLAPGGMHNMSERFSQIWTEAKMNVFRYAVSYFLEFTWTAVVAINGKFTRGYTGFRSELETFVHTSCELAVTGVTSASSSAAPSATSHLQLGANFSDLLDAGWATGGNVKDESDEMKTLERIKNSIAAVKASGMVTFIQDVLPLPLSYHAGFAKGRQTLATDPSVNVDCSLQTIIQKIFDVLQTVLPPRWLSFAADVCDMYAERLDFVAASSEVFCGQKQVLERFTSMRSLYTLALL